MLWTLKFLLDALVITHVMAKQKMNSRWLKCWWQVDTEVVQSGFFECRYFLVDPVDMK